jgi:hypothetical protein
MQFFTRLVLSGILFLTFTIASAQRLVTNRSSFYVLTGSSSAKLNQFDQLLADRGLSGLRNRYRTYGIGYQARVNDFVLGLELYHNQGRQSIFDDYKLSYRTSRALLNIGYSFTEESKFQLIHYMSIGVGFLNFQMLPTDSPNNLQSFLAQPQKGFILRAHDIQKGTQNFGNFLTEIGFQLSFDFDLPGRPEAVQVISKLGYSFSPFEGKWNMAGISFDNTQSGAFFRIGAGLSLPDRNFFYKDAGIGIYLIKGIHFTDATRLNEQLTEAGYEPLSGTPSNWGLRILGNTEKFLYGAEVFNLALSDNANSTMDQSLNSLRVYANGGYKFFQFRNFGLSALAGLGFGNIRYTLDSKVKPDFPELFEQRDFDGYLRNSGLMIKPEVFAEYSLPVTNRNLFNLIFSASAGYEMPIGNYRLGEFDMVDFMAGPYLSFGIGIRP